MGVLLQQRRAVGFINFKWLAGTHHDALVFLRQRQLEAQLMTSFEPGGAPLARLLWFAGKGKKSVVAMVFHHSIADGKSGASVLLEVLRRATGDDAKAVLKQPRDSSQQLDLIKTSKPVEGKLKELRFWLDTGWEDRTPRLQLQSLQRSGPPREPP